MGFGQPYVPTRHPSPRAALLATPAEAADGCPWTGACSSAGTHMGMSGRTRGNGPSQGCAGPGCCPNMVLHFVSPPEFCRLHCGREEAEEWAAPQIVSVLAASWDGHEGSGCPSTLQPNGRSRLSRVLFPALVQVSPLLETCSGLVGGFFLPLGCRKVGSTSSKGTGDLERDPHSQGLEQPGAACSSVQHQSSLLTPRRHLRTSLRRGARSPTVPWATTTVSHALLGNFEVTAPTCWGEVGPEGST